MKHTSNRTQHLIKVSPKVTHLLGGLVSTIHKKMVFQYLMLIISWNENCYFAKSRTINFNHWKKKQKEKKPWNIHTERKRKRGTQTTFAGQIAPYTHIHTHTLSMRLHNKFLCYKSSWVLCMCARVSLHILLPLSLSLSFTLTHECRVIFSHYYNFFRLFCGLI